MKGKDNFLLFLVVISLFIFSYGLGRHHEEESELKMQKDARDDEKKKEEWYRKLKHWRKLKKVKEKEKGLENITNKAVGKIDGNTRNNNIEIAGVMIVEDKMPNLYKLAQNDPVGLEAKLKSLDKAAGSKSNLASTAINFENDLQHDRSLGDRPDLPDWFR
jgi:hypothetical protein